MSLPFSFARGIVLRTLIPATVYLVTLARSETYVFTTLAGSPGNSGFAEGTGAAARFYHPIGIAVDASGTVFVGDGFDGDSGPPGGVIRSITPDGVVTTLAGSSSSVGLVDGAGNAARFNGVSGIGLDASGNVFVADTLNSKIRKVTPAGVVTTVAVPTLFGYPPGVIGFPYGVAVDSGGNVFFALGQTIQKLTPNGVVATVVAGDPNTISVVLSATALTNPRGMAVDSRGNLFVADTSAHTLTKVTPAGDVTRIAGSPGRSGSDDGTGDASRFLGPNSVAVDGSGNLFVTDGNRVRKVTPEGVVTTVSQIPGAGPGSVPSGVDIAIDGSGNLYITTTNYTVQKGVRFDGVVPVIAAQSQSQTVARGHVAVLTVTATGSPAPSYQWTKNGSLLAGATDATLILTNVSDASAGAYQCTATNAGGAVTSQRMILSVVDAVDTGRFINFSVRASVLAGRSVSAGFVVEGSRPKNVLVRGLGPALAQFGVSGALADPALVVMNAAGQSVAVNDDWPAVLASVFPAVGAFALPVGSKDASVVLPLQPGSYTVALSGATGGAGEALLEMYEVP